MADTFERFTERARNVFMLAQEESALLNHNDLGTEHLLLGLVREGNGIAARALASLGVTLPKARDAVAALVERGEGPLAAAATLTPQAKKAIERAMDEARHLNNRYVGTEHLLLGLVLEREGTAVAALAHMGVRPEQVQQQVMEIVGQAPSYQQQSGQQSTEQEAQEPPLPEADVRWQKFTERARKIFSLAQEEAQRFNHNYIGTEHLLLGLVREGEGIAARVLANLGVQLPKVRSAVEFIIGHGDGLVVGDPGLTPRAKKVIELAMDEARRLSNHYIGTEHLLLGIIREGEGIAAGVLESLGVSLGRVRQSVMQVVSQGSSRVQHKEESSPTILPSQRPPFYYMPTGLGFMLTMHEAEWDRLQEIARQHNRPLDDLLREAIRRTWLTDEQDTDAPEQPAPPSDP